MWWSTTREMTFLVQFRSTMGRKLDRGPSGFLGFCSTINVPLPRESNAVCCSNIMLVMLARGVKITLGAYFINSLLMSGPGAHPLLRHPSACATSAAVTVDWVGMDCQWMGRVVHQIDQKTALQTIHEWHQIRSYTFAILGVSSQKWGTFGRFDGLNCLKHFVAVIR